MTDNILSEFQNREWCMHCETEEEANLFLEYLDGLGKRWCDGTPYIDDNEWETHEEDTVYFFNQGTFGSYEYTDKKYVLECGDFDFGTVKPMEESDIPLSFLMIGDD